MPRDSRSPPRRRSGYNGDSQQYNEQRNGGYGGDRRRYEDREPPRRSETRGAPRNNDSHLYGYGERERERERARDRERYDSGRDRRSDRDRGHAGPSSSRRSASPRARSSRNHSEPPPSGSGSPSPAEDKAKPNFKPSGLLAAETNTVQAVDGKTSTVLKYNEPPEARKPLLGWRLYVFKGSEQVELLHIHRQSAYLIGRDRLVADIAIDHPSSSKQHAAIQYRRVQEKDEFGAARFAIKPFIIDLESTNSTIVNDETIPAARYYELKAGDVIKFGQSTREYVLLHDEAAAT